MDIAVSLPELRDRRKALSGTLGLVPTMGFLHEGHLSLVRIARQRCDHVAASIYVNPTQFSPSEDLSSYPRDLERDLSLLDAEGVDLVWTPRDEDMYPEGFQTWVEVGEITKLLEGSYRPTHFRGVTTVVTKLFLAFMPDVAVFGQKDAQQALVVQRIVRDLHFPIEIIVAPIMRDSDGLALSSRNTYLSKEERHAACVLHRSLLEAEAAFHKGERNADVLRERVLSILSDEPLAKTQYVSVADPHTLEERHGKTDRVLISMAVYVGRTRLIDNMLLGMDTLAI